jgi:rod shape-determining protein MreD
MNADKPLVPQGPELLAPVSARMVAGTLALGYLATLLPWPDGIRWLVPDFTLIVLLYWCIHAPDRASLGLAMALGLLNDLTQGGLIGLHALTYTLSAFAGLRLRRRLENFEVSGRALHLAPVFLGQQALSLLLGLAFHLPDVDWRFLAAGLSSAVLWIPLAHVLDKMTGWTSEMRIEPADNRPRTVIRTRSGGRSKK